MPPVPLRLPSLLTALLPLLLVACTQPASPQPVTARSAVIGSGVVLHSQSFEEGLGGWTSQTLSGTGSWQVLTQPENLSISAELNPFAVTLADDGRHLPAADGVSVARFGDSTGTFIGSDYGPQYPKGGGSSTVSQAGTLTSPSISLTEISFAQLEFASWWEIEGVAGSYYDLMTVLLSVNGGEFQELGRLNPNFVVQQPGEAAYSSGGPSAPPVVRNYAFDLSPYVNSEIRVQFKFDSVDSSYNAFRGFTVDNVRITASNEVLGPELFSVQPPVATGGDSVALTAANLQQGASFYVGSQLILPHELTQFGVDHAVFSLPTLAPGLYDVRVINPDGREFTLPASLEYAGAASPSVTSISPDSASVGAAQVVSIGGANFQAGAVVLIGSVEGQSAVVQSAELITVTVPGLGAGTHNVTVQNSNGQSGTLYAAYTVTASSAQPTSTLLQSGSNPSVENSPVQFTALLTPQVSEGTVQFLVAGAPFGEPVPVSNGVAVSLPYVFVGGGYPITTQYSGTAGFTPSSGSLYQEVDFIPMANDQELTTAEDQALPFELDGTDPGGDLLSYQVLTQPQQGLLLGTPPSLNYLPAPDFSGQVSFTYQVNDGRSDSRVATVFIFVNPQNDAPVAVNLATGTAEDTTLPISLTASDVDSGWLTWTVSSPAHGTLEGTPPDLIYIPSPDFSGEDSFTFIASDGEAFSNEATVTISVTPVNDAPLAHAQSQTTGEDTGLDLTLTGEDPDAPPPTLIPSLKGQDPDGARRALRLVASPLNFTVVTPPTHGTLSGVAPQLRYQPDADFHGEDSFTFRVNDGELDSQEATVTLNVTPINDAPVADALALTLDEDVATPVTLGGSDVDQDPLEWTVVTQPQHGTLSGTAPELTYTPNPDFHGEDSFTYSAGDGALESEVATVSLLIQSVNDAPQASTQQVLTDEDLAVAVSLEGSDTEEDPLTFQVVDAPSHGTLSGVPPELTYSPASNFHGEDRFTFKSHDGQVDSEPRTILITVAPINDAPVATARSASTEEDGEVGFTLTGTDVDGDELTYTVVTQPAHGTLSGTPPQLTYTPYPDFTGADSFTFQANDGDAHSGPATVTLAVGPVNDAPVAEGSAVITEEDTAAQLTLRAHDVDGDALAWTVLTAPQHGTLSGTAPNLTYQPADDFWGDDSFTFQVNDGLADSNVVTVSVGISSIDDAPVASAQAITLTEDMATTLTLQGSDTEGAALSYTVVSGPAHGTLSGEAPHLTYRPVSDYQGEDSFTFRVTAEGMDSQPATVSITVGASEDLLAGGGLGCSSTPGGFGAWMLLALGGLLFRRGRAIPRSLGALGALALLLTVPEARAQTALPSLEVEALRLNAGAADGLASGAGLLLEQGALRLSLTGHHERDPLVYFRNGQRVGAIVANRASAHLAVAWAPLQWLEVGAQLPVVLLQTGDDLSTHGLGSPEQSTVGTSLLQARAALWQQSRGGLLDLALGLGVQLPMGGSGAVASEPGLLGQVEAGYALTSWLRMGGQLGLALRPSSTFDGQALRRSTVEGALLVHTVGKGLRGELSWHTALPTEGGPLRNELFAGARLPLGKWVEIYGLGGIGLGSAPGTPAYRILAGAAFTLGRPSAPLAPRAETAPSAPVQPAPQAPPPIVELPQSCPMAPGSLATEGCPAVPLSQPQLNALGLELSQTLATGRMFQASHTTLAPEAQGALDRLVALVQSHPEIQQLRLVGHCDSSGGYERNFALSLDRAQAVRDLLISRGMAPELIVTTGVGAERPIASNATPEGREANRRVEVLLRLTRAPVPAS
ncbi:MAG: Ig-like domain-containing protein [Myxococcota bacterium]|nr:Ig-like domain-containing protein [Myxococcota bacterium]